MCSSAEEEEVAAEPPKRKKPAPKSVKAKASWSKSQRLLKKVSPRPSTPKGRKGRPRATPAKTETDEAESADSESEEDLVSSNHATFVYLFGKQTQPVFAVAAVATFYMLLLYLLF